MKNKTSNTSIYHDDFTVWGKDPNPIGSTSNTVTATQNTNTTCTYNPCTMTYTMKASDISNMKISDCTAATQNYTISATPYTISTTPGIGASYTSDYGFFASELYSGLKAFFNATTDSEVKELCEKAISRMNQNEMKSFSPFIKFYISSVHCSEEFLIFCLSNKLITTKDVSDFYRREITTGTFPTIALMLEAN